MERDKKRPIKDTELANSLEFIYRNAFGLPLILDSAPTSAQMKANSWAKNGTDIYIRFGDGVTLKISGTTVS